MTGRPWRVVEMWEYTGLRATESDNKHIQGMITAMHACMDEYLWLQVS